MKRKFLFIFFTLLLWLPASRTYAKIAMPSIFGDHMVLQQSSNVSIWGTSNKKNAKISVKGSWNNKTQTVFSDNSGFWRIKIATPSAGGPFLMRISDGDKLIINDILIGEVWVCSGQSNMSMPLMGYMNQPINNSQELILNAENPQLRLFKIETASTLSPAINCSANWNISTPLTASNFSAIGYMYGKLLQKRLKVPVGIIVSAVGGTKIQSWMSKESLQPFKEVNIPSSLDSFPKPILAPTALYNAMIAPIVGLGIKGFIWYQGESNVGEPFLYEKLFPAMVASWRESWNCGELPFYYVQIAPFGTESLARNPRLREIQLKCMSIIPNSGMAVTMDLGLQDFIHPPEKMLVSQRLAYWAFAKTYQIKGIACSGPIYKSMEKKGSKLIVQFDYAANGLISSNNELKLFEVAGENRVFHPAKAKILADGSLEIQNDSVNDPIALRYAFKQSVKGDLFNSLGLPASSFRTDNW